jgi:hypothetical protein
MIPAMRNSLRTFLLQESVTTAYLSLKCARTSLHSSYQPANWHFRNESSQLRAYRLDLDTDRFEA